MGQAIELTAADGHKLAAYRADPAGTPRGAVVVIQEIFGVNSHIRSVADGYAADGYLALAPAMYDRAQRGYETGYSQPEIQAGVAIMQKLDWKQTLIDVSAAIETVKSAGKVGIVGYCWGGTVAWVAACRRRGLACSAPYYGGAIPNFISEQPKCPVMFHFGEQDHSITLEQAKKIAAAHPEASAHFYPAGHGFNCDQRGSFNAESAKLARERTVAFLRKYVG
ncbi:MAG: dienelactone hydrolase family protein [Burkholderiales bacterium]